jgi:hypothetical protein
MSRRLHISGAVVRDLLKPEIGIPLHDGGMLVAAVPKASIEKDGYSQAGKGNITGCPL